jgi:hypothetical protein
MVVVVLCACGHVDKVSPDAPDAPPDAPGPGPVTVKAQVECCTGMDGVINVPVLAFAPDGTLRDRTMTDAMGNATVNVMAGDSVTLVYPLDPQGAHIIETTTEVEPGDHLVYGGFFPPAGGLQGAVSVTWPAQGNIQNWSIVTPCGTQTVTNGAATSTSVQVTNCPATFSLLIEAINSAGQAVAWNVIDNVTPTSQINVPSFRAPAQFTINVTSPTNIDFSIEADPMVGTNRGLGFSAEAPNGGPLQSTGFRAIGPDGTKVLWLALPKMAGTMFGNQNGSDVLTPDTALFQGNYGMLPGVGRPQYDATNHAITWPEGAGTAYDIATPGISWSSTDGNSSFNWELTVRPGTGAAMRSVAIPQLPSDIDLQFPTDPMQVFPFIQLLQNLDIADDYKTARNTPQWQMRPSTGATPRIQTSNSP